MSDPSRLFFTGTTLEQAVLAAATHFGLSPDDVRYEKVERKSGFLRGRKRFVIRVDANAPKKTTGGSSSVEEPEAESSGAKEESVAVEVSAGAGSSPADHAEGAARTGDGQAAPGEVEVRDKGDARDVVLSGAESGDEPIDGSRGPANVPASDATAAAAAAVATAMAAATTTTTVTSGEVESELAAGTGDRDTSSSTDSDPEKTSPRRTPRHRNFASRDDDVDVRDLEPASGDDVDDVLDAFDLLAQLGDLEITAEVYRGEDQFLVEIEGEDQPRVVRGEGRLLLAVQHLLPRVLQGLTGEMIPCRVDSRGFRRRRVVELEKMARQVADEVRERNRPKTLQSMTPADRRTVHMTLKDETDVITESQGHGFFKRITVRPS